MAKDAEIKVVLDIQSAIQQAKALGPELEKALSFTPKNDYWKKQQKEIGSYKKQLKSLSSTYDKLTANEEKLSKIRGRKDVLSGEKGVKGSIKNLQSAIGGSKDKEAAKQAVADAQREFEQLSISEKKLEGQQTRLTSTFQKQYTAIEKTGQVAHRLITAHEGITSSSKKDTQTLQENADATQELIEKKEELVNEESKLASQNKDTSPTADTTTDEEIEERTKSLKEQVQEIHQIRDANKDASKEFEEFEKRLRSFDTANASAHKLAKFLEEIREAMAYIEKDTKFADNIKDAYDVLSAAKAPVQKAQRGLKKQAETSGNDAAQQAAQQAQLEKERLQLEKERAAAQAAQEKWEAQRQAYLEKRAAERQKIYDRIAEQDRKQVQREQATVMALVALGEQLEIEEAQRQAKQIQDRQNYVTALNGLFAQQETAYKEAVQNAIDTTDRIENAMNFDKGKVGIAELTRRLMELGEVKKVLEDLSIPEGTDKSYETAIRLIDELKEKISEYKTDMKGTSFADTFKNVSPTIKKVTSSIRQGFQTAQRIVTKAISVMRSAVNSFVKLFRSGFKIVGNAINKVKSHFSGMSSSMRSNFKHLITSLTKYVLGFRSLFFLVRRLRKYVGEGIQNLAQFNDGNNEVNRSITRLLSSLLFLKNAWAAAFSPIITFVSGWLSMLIDKLAEVGNAIAKFIGRLTGQAVVFNAVKVDAQDYAQSLGDVGSSAGGAADKTKKLTDRLAAFDDLNVLGKDNDNDNTGSGGGGGADEIYTPDPNEMFKIVDAGQDLLQKLKDMWANADFSELGETLSERFAEALNNINWPKIQLIISKIGKSIGTFLTGALSNQDLWKEIGEAIGEGINSLSLFLNSLLTSSDFNIGEGILTLITTALDTINFDVIKSNFDMLGDKLIEALNTLVDGLAEEDGEGISALAESLTTFITKAINGIHWDSILSIASTIGSSILDGIIQGLTATPEGSFTNALGNFMNSLKTAFEEKDPTEAANGLTTFLSGVFANIDFNTLWTNAQTFFNQLFTNIFSSIQIEDDGSMFSGLFNTLKGVGETLGNVFSTVIGLIPQVLPGLMLITDASMNFINALLPLIEIILPPLNNLIAQITSLISALLVPALQLLQPVFTAIALILDAVSPIIEQIVGFITDSTSGTESLLEPLTELVTTLLTPLSVLLPPIMHIVQIILDLVTDILNPIMELISPLLEILNDCLSPLSDVFDVIGELLDYSLIPLLNLFASVIRVVVVPILKLLVTGVQSASGVISMLSTTVRFVLAGLKTLFEKAGTFVKSWVNSIIGGIEWLINKIIGAFNSLIRVMNGLSFDIPDWVPNIGGGKFGFSLKEMSTISIPRLAQGAVIPPNKEFMAVLGDQSRGTNIEAPLDTIKQAVAEVAGNEEVIQLLQQLISVVESKNLTIGDKDIGKANARYTQQQKLIRGTSF